MPKKTLTGTIVSAKQKNTVVVEVESFKSHPKYKKRYRVFKKYKAHDEEDKLTEGDRVTIEESRPLSKQKRWRVKRLAQEHESNEV